MNIVVTGPSDSDSVKRSVLNRIRESDYFTAVFFVLSSINQLQNLGLINNYLEVPRYSETVFYSLRDYGYIVADQDVKNILNRSEFWDAETKEKLFKFYKAYHAMAWDIGDDSKVTMRSGGLSGL